MRSDGLAPFVLDLRDIDAPQFPLVGGKAARLGELTRTDGVRVPPGFCVTTQAFRRILTDAPSIDDLLDRLPRLGRHDTDAIRTLSAEIRRVIEGAPIPNEIAAAITAAVRRLGDETACAVRSSATDEDLPTASFAGQHDSYLNVVGPAAILQHVRRCWASLYTERAVSYRIRNEIDHRSVRMAVVVQQMVFPDAAGVLFTADPVTSNRRIVTVEATFGLGEALVSGLVNADVYQVRDGEIIARDIATKARTIQASPTGGTNARAVDPAQQERPALSDPQVVELADLGRRIEAHLGRPQDIEWCLAGDDIQVVQSRPITTLFPIPDVGDQDNHVYVSVGHGQMMTDPMRPLGLSVWQLTAAIPMHVAAGRLFVDVTRGLASPSSRAGLLEVFGRSDPLLRDALETVLHREGFLPTTTEDGPGPPAPGAVPAPIETDPAIVAELIERSEASVAALQRDIRTVSGEALFDFIATDIGELKRLLSDPQSHQAVMAGMQAAWWLNDQLQAWLGEASAADALAQSAPHNVTSEMGLALLDVADVIRAHPQVVSFMDRVEDDDFLEQFGALPGGPEARGAIEAWLDRYGMRCVGEIDITRPRWSERPSTLVPVILGNVRAFESGAHERRFEQGLQEALRTEQRLLERLRSLPDGEPKAAETQRMIERLRTFIGYREYPKYVIVRRYFEYKKALLDEAQRLVDAGVLRDREDIYDLTFAELRDVVGTGRLDVGLVERRKEEFRSYHALTPPRVLTSEGEALSGAYRRDDVPSGALVGLAVSAGIVEGRARVVLDMAEARLEPGDILVTTHTDPSWSPLFVAISGLVTEVGGLMTHGAVIAREYGLPAVVGVQEATRLIQDGQRIRLDGTSGLVEIVGRGAPQ